MAGGQGARRQGEGAQGGRGHAQGAADRRDQPGGRRRAAGDATREHLQCPPYHGTLPSLTWHPALPTMAPCPP
eukprot:7110042-Prymnesium_polylepis.1